MLDRLFELIYISLKLGVKLTIFVNSSLKKVLKRKAR